MKRIVQKIDFWNLFVGVVIGFGSGVWIVNAMVPDANELIRMYRLDQKSVTEDKEARNALRTQGTIQIEQ